jgi:Mg-chelatase subunit ChlD
MSYDANGIVQVEAHQRDTGHQLAMTVEPVPDDLSWLGRPVEVRRESATPTRIFLLIDTSASMAGAPLMEAQSAARAFVDRCDFTRTEVGLVSFSDAVALQAEATDNARRVHAAINRLEADGTTNLADALALARGHLVGADRRRYVVILTDGYPDAADAAIEEAEKTRGAGIDIVAIGMGAADLDYLRRIASTESGSIFARHGELVTTFGSIARIIAEGGRGLRALT